MCTQFNTCRWFTAVTPLLTRWSYRSPALSHRCHYIHSFSENKAEYIRSLYNSYLTEVFHWCTLLQWVTAVLLHCIWTPRPLHLLCSHPRVPPPRKASLNDEKIIPYLLFLFLIVNLPFVHYLLKQIAVTFIDYEAKLTANASLMFWWCHRLCFDYHQSYNNDIGHASDRFTF